MYGMSTQVQSGAHCLEVRRGGGCRRNSAIAGAAAISAASSGRFESSTRSGLRASVVTLWSDSAVEVAAEVAAQRVDVAGALLGRSPSELTSSVDLAQAERCEEAPAEGDHLDVDHRVVAAEHLEVDLVELAVAATLGALVAQQRPGAPHLPWRRRTVLDERPAHRRGELRPQGDVTATVVGEPVHLLLHEVGGVADPGEHAVVLEQRRDHLAVAGRRRRSRRTRRRTACAAPIPAAGRRASRDWSGTAARPVRLRRQRTDRQSAADSAPDHRPTAPGSTPVSKSRNLATPSSGGVQGKLRVLLRCPQRRHPPRYRRVWRRGRRRCLLRSASTATCRRVTSCSPSLSPAQ